MDDAVEHWDRPGLVAAVRAALHASGADPASLTMEDLAPLDQFHAGGLGFTRRLAVLGELAPGMRVLDVGGGIGGPARTLAREHGCQVTVVDLAPSYVETGRMLTDLTGLGAWVTFLVGNALALPFADGTIDVVWTQNSGMNVADKARLYAGFRRVLARGGRLVTQEPVAGPNGPPVYPLMWAADPAASHLLAAGDMRATIVGAGFAEEAWQVVVPPRPVARPVGVPARPQPATIQSIVMGPEHLAAIAEAARRNEDEGRIRLIHAVFRAV